MLMFLTDCNMTDDQYERAGVKDARWALCDVYAEMGNAPQLLSRTLTVLLLSLTHK